MNKYLKIFLSGILFSVLILLGNIAFAGILSNPYDSSAECETAVANYNLQDTEFTRSSCYLGKNYKYYYNVCAFGIECLPGLEHVTNTTSYIQTEDSSNNPYTRDINVKILKKLVTIIDNLKKIKVGKTEIEFNNIIDDLNSKLDKMKLKYPNSILVLNLVGYLKFEIAKLGQGNEEEDFFCTITGDCGTGTGTDTGDNGLTGGGNNAGESLSVNNNVGTSNNNPGASNNNTAASTIDKISLTPSSTSVNKCDKVKFTWKIEGVNILRCIELSTETQGNTAATTANTIYDSSKGLLNKTGAFEKIINFNTTTRVICYTASAIPNSSAGQVISERYDITSIGATTSGMTCGITCPSGKHVEDAVCVSNTKTGSCSIINGVGAQIWNFTNSSYGSCYLASCNTGYTVSGNTCSANSSNPTTITGSNPAAITGSNPATITGSNPTGTGYPALDFWLSKIDPAKASIERVPSTYTTPSDNGYYPLQGSCDNANELVTNACNNHSRSFSIGGYSAFWLTNNVINGGYNVLGASPILLSCTNGAIKYKCSVLAVKYEFLVTATPANLSWTCRGDGSNQYFCNATGANSGDQIACPVNPPIASQLSYTQPVWAGVSICKSSGCECIYNASGKYCGYISDGIANFGTKTIGTPTSINQAWQYSTNPGSCTYTCLNGFTGPNCSTAPIIPQSTINAFILQYKDSPDEVARKVIELRNLGYIITNQMIATGYAALVPSVTISLTDIDAFITNYANTH